MENSFYQRTGGVTLLVIKHKGKKFDYVNGYKGCDYFPKWDPLLPFMENDKYYVIACAVKINKSEKVSLMPFGVAFECESEEVAREVSHQHRRDVDDGSWSAEKEYIQLREDWTNYQKAFFEKMKSKTEVMSKKAETLIGF